MLVKYILRFDSEPRLTNPHPTGQVILLRVDQSWVAHPFTSYWNGNISIHKHVKLMPCISGVLGFWVRGGLLAGVIEDQAPFAIPKRNLWNVF